MKLAVASLTLSFIAVFCSAALAFPAEKTVTRAQADAMVQAITTKTPYVGTDVYPLKNDAGETKFYSYALIADRAVGGSALRLNELFAGRVSATMKFRRADAAACNYQPHGSH